MVHTLEDFYTESVHFIDIFGRFTAKHALSTRALPDHICYKSASNESFEKVRALFEPEIRFLYQAQISGRRIAYIRLPRAIETALGPIAYLELSDQKPDNSQTEGFDHIEVYPTSMNYREMVEEFEKTETVTRVVRPHHTTHDIDMGDGFLFRCTEGPLIEKIRVEMLLP